MVSKKIENAHLCKERGSLKKKIENGSPKGSLKNSYFTRYRS